LRFSDGALSPFVKTRAPWWVLLAAILLVAAVLRFYQLGTESLWMDEAWSIRESGESISQIVAHSNQPPLYFLILRFWIRLWGTGESAIRSLSAVIGVAAVGVTFLTGSALFGRRAALVAALLSAISAFQIYFSQEARGYALLMLLTALSFLFFIRSLRSDRMSDHIAYLASSLLMGYTHFFSWFLILAQVAYLLLRPPVGRARRLKHLITFAALFVFLIPQLLLLKGIAASLTGGGFWIATPTLATIAETMQLFSVSPEWRIGSYAVTAMFAGLSLWGLFSLRRRSDPPDPSSIPARIRSLASRLRLDGPGESLLLVLWLFVPVTVAFVESRLLTPIYWHRYLIGSSPALVLLVAKSLARINRRSIFWVALTAIVLMSSPGLYRYYENDVKEQWREVAALVESESLADDTIVFNVDLAAGPFRYYFKGSQAEALAGRDLADLDAIVAARGAAGPQGRYWLLISQSYDRQEILDRLTSGYGLQSVLLERQYVGVLVILLNPRPAATTRPDGGASKG
jgi:mannosyltransferase